MADAIELPKLSIPSGGGAVRSMGESYTAEEFTGAATLQLPLSVTACREVTPQLTLGYATGNGNGVFGMGFALPLARISRRTDTHIPRYDDRDEFVVEGGDVLVVALQHSGDDWIPIVEECSEGGIDYRVTRYRGRVDKDATRYERWQRLSDNDEHWRILDTAGTIAVLGSDAATRIVDPTGPDRVFAWLLERSTTILGDRVLYTYKSENDANLPSLPSQAGRDNRANKYIQSIRYGAYTDDNGNDAYALSVVFDYGEYDIASSNPDPFTPVREWPARPDPFSSYRSGFEIRTNRLCRSVLMFHAFAELGELPCLAGATTLEYALLDGLSTVQKADFMGYRRQDDGTYDVAALPGLRLEYQPFEPEQQAFRPVRPRTGTFPAPLEQGSLTVADLLGEGMPGLLFSSDTLCEFWRNLGDGCFAAPLTPEEMPVQRALSSGRQWLVSLEGNGQLDCVVADVTQAGYYRRDNDKGWEAFRPFTQWATEAGSPETSMADLSGDGLSDLLVMQKQRLRWYPGEGEQGYGTPVELTLPQGLPVPGESSAQEFVGFADPFGDGGTHLLRVRDGCVECWPGLGYGRFGERVLFNQSPAFPGGLDTSRLLIADVSGSGAADLLYLTGGRVLLYANAAGDGFAEPVEIALPANFTQLSYTGAGDLLGGGSQNLLLGTQTQGQWLIDFTGGRKPWLLAGLLQAAGGRTDFTYAPSTRFALADALAGRPWPCSLPFPVQVVTSIRVSDPFAGALRTTQMAYHDGYYDPLEKNFNGFGHVEQWIDDLVDGERYASTSHTRAWYETGAFEGGAALTLHSRMQYWHGDARLQPPLPDSAIHTFDGDSDARLLETAYRSLKGRPLRRETYDLDGASNQNVPVSVSDYSYRVREMQPSRGEDVAVFQVSTREEIDIVYERDATDPRSKQRFDLEVDDFGHVLRSATVAYRRDQGNTSPPPMPGSQAQTLVTLACEDYAPSPDNAYLPSMLAETLTYQIGQFSLSAGEWFDFTTLDGQIRAALKDVIPPEQPFSGPTPQARMRLTTRHLYWDATQSEPLPLREVVVPPLPHHQESTRLSVGMASEVYGVRLSEKQIQDEGLLSLDAGYWWAPGPIEHYSAASAFYRPISSTDAAGTVTSVTYDSYALAVVTSTTPDGTSTATTDYQTLQATTLVDVNGTVSEMLPDPLGRVIVSTQYHAPSGGQRQGDGDIASYTPLAAPDLAAVLAHPADYLQAMSAYFFYGFQVGSGQPPVVLSVARQFHVSQLSTGESSPLRLVLTYADLRGNTLETKTAVEAAACGLPHDTWLSRDRKQFDLRSTAFRSWKPAFEDSSAFSGYVGGWYDTDWTDAQGRTIRTLTAKGFLASAVYRAWSNDNWDLDDDVTTSPYYLAHIDDTSPAFADERRALEQAAVFADTYLTQWLDPLGRDTDLEQRNLSSVQPTVHSMVTTSVLDVDGRAVALADPRFTASNQSGGTPCYNIVTRYDLAGNAIAVHSVDAGERWMFVDALDRLVHQWDSRDVHAQRRYDAMSRLTDVYVDGALGLQQIVERITYGTDATTNAIGRRIELRDESGLTLEGNFDLGGVPTQASFALREDYASEVNWNPGETVTLEPPLPSSSERDAFGDLVDKISVDGSRQVFTYYTLGWLTSITLTLASQSTRTVIDGATYNAYGNRTYARLGSGILAARAYEDSTGRLTGIDTSRSSDSKALQTIGYTYDPMGNVTCAEDATVPLVFCNQSQIGPRQDYGYDAIYRLLQATGRENPAITASTYRTGFKQSVYIPLCPDNPADGVKLVTYAEAYSYDDSGNLTRLVHATPLSALSWTREYSVATRSNRVRLDPESGDPDAAYDANGNMVDFDQLRAMAWDWRNRPQRATVIDRGGADDDAQFYVYNAEGRRVRRVTQRLTAGGLQVDDKVYLDGCELTRKLPSGGTPEVERTGISVSDGRTRLLMFCYWPEAAGRVPQSRYAMGTLTGSSALELESDGSVISYEEYFPYGGTSIIAGNSQTEVAQKEYRFCGKECDDATGLYDFGERYYATWLARWISPDPNGPIDSLNLYEYVGCNPLSAVDPTGGCKVKVTMPAPSSSTSTQDFTSFENSYGYLSSSATLAYQQLSFDLHVQIYKYQPKAYSDTTERLPPKMEQRLLDMFDAHKDLHIASNPALLSVFRTAQAKAKVDDDTGSVKAYTKMRSPYFTNAMNDTEMGDIVADDDFLRTVELHHGAKKAFRPDLATDAKNLWALTRGSSSSGLTGQHEGAFHLVGAAGFGNRFVTEVGAYTGLLLHWEGIDKLSGPAPGLPPPPIVQTYPVPSIPSFSVQPTFQFSVPQPQTTVPIWSVQQPSTSKSPFFF